MQALASVWSPDSEFYAHKKETLYLVLQNSIIFAQIYLIAPLFGLSRIGNWVQYFRATEQ